VEWSRWENFIRVFFKDVKYLMHDVERGIRQLVESMG
jgi:hypothetical protein